MPVHSAGVAYLTICTVVCYLEKCQSSAVDNAMFALECTMSAFAFLWGVVVAQNMGFYNQLQFVSAFLCIRMGCQALKGRSAESLRGPLDAPQRPSIAGPTAPRLPNGQPWNKVAVIYLYVQVCGRDKTTLKPWHVQSFATLTETICRSILPLTCF